MRILHTSDWHLGRTLYGRRRYAEFESFLAWLVHTIEQQAVDAVLVAGDVFDTSAPSNRAQQLYYRFLCQIAASACRHVVVIGGNHDSPTFLDAPRELLKALDVHVVGSCSESARDEVLVLRDGQEQARLIVCAVPYLRDRDIRQAEAGETIEDKERKLLEGIRAHYAKVAGLAEQQRAELGAQLPVVAMGHLFTAGGQTIDGDGVRELYVGSLAHVTAGIFPPTFDYVALGHLHVPQAVGGKDSIRYSGSPLAMGFGEAKQQKSLCLVDVSPGRNVTVELLDVPIFQPLERIKGDLDAILRRLLELSVLYAEREKSLWLEVIYDGAEVVGDLREQLEQAINGTSLEILRIKNNRVTDVVLGQMHVEETLDDLSLSEVFTRCLETHRIPHEQQAELRHSYLEIVASLQEDDTWAQHGDSQ